MKVEMLVQGHPYIYDKDAQREVLYNRIVNLHDGKRAYQFRFRNKDGNACFCNITEDEVNKYIKEYAKVS